MRSLQIIKLIQSESEIVQSNRWSVCLSVNKVSKRSKWKVEIASRWDEMAESNDVQAECDGQWILLGAPVVYTRPAVVMVSFLHGGEGNYYLIVVCARSHRGTARHGPFSDKCQNELHVRVESYSGRMSVIVFLLFIAPYNCWNCLRCHNNDNVTKVWITVWWTAGPIISASTVAPFCFLFFLLLIRISQRECLVLVT